MIKINRALTLIAVCVFLLAGNLTAQQSAKLSDAEIDQKVDSLMKKMSLVDKVGEMTQLAIDMITDEESYKEDEPHRLSEEKLKEVLLKYRVGSILNVAGHSYSVDHWHEIIGRIQQFQSQQKELRS